MHKLGCGVPVRRHDGRAVQSTCTAQSPIHHGRPGGWGGGVNRGTLPPADVAVQATRRRRRGRSHRVFHRPVDPPHCTGQPRWGLRAPDPSPVRATHGTAGGGTTSDKHTKKKRLKVVTEQTHLPHAHGQKRTKRQRERKKKKDSAAKGRPRWKCAATHSRANCVEAVHHGHRRRRHASGRAVPVRLSGTSRR